MTNGSATWNMTYNADGLRTKRTNGTTYYYLINLQGDVVGITTKAGVQVVAYTYDAWGRLLSTTGTSASTIGLNNPLRYRGYVFDRETGLYYLQSRYYSPKMGRFINADAFVSTGQRFLGSNLFTYCLNNPVNYIDRCGRDVDAYTWWVGSMWWLCGVDATLLIGDLAYLTGIIVLGGTALYAVHNDASQITWEKEKTQDEPETPDVTYPGDDPTKAPEGTEWRGKGEPGSKEGSYYDPNTGESWHPDLNHPDGIPPHWDYNFRGSGVKGWRVFGNGEITLKP